jgi:2-methylcitrate dehydratase PrpD
VAAAWIDGRLGLEHFTEEGVRRADLLALAGRVQPYIDAEIDREWSRSISPANVTIEFHDGKVLETRADYPRGHPNNMMTEAEFAAKTADCATFAAGSMRPDTAARLTSAVGALESLADISGLTRIMTP